MTGHVKNVRCPECGCETVTYNGNYYCDDGRGYSCGWTMDSDGISDVDEAIIVSYLKQCRAEAEIRGNGEEVRRMEFYLRHYEKGENDG